MEREKDVERDWNRDRRRATETETGYCRVGREEETKTWRKTGTETGGERLRQRDIVEWGERKRQRRGERLEQRQAESDRD